MFRFAARPLIAACATWAGCSAYAQEPPPVVLTDTLSYCIHLQHMLQDRAARPADVNRLLTEGRRMCDHGEVRPGIARLRRALWLLHHPLPLK